LGGTEDDGGNSRITKAETGSAGGVALTGQNTKGTLVLSTVVDDAHKKERKKKNHNKQRGGKKKDGGCGRNTMPPSQEKHEVMRNSLLWEGEKARRRVG